MSLVFEVRDKTGRSIRLTKERYQHILKHPEMANQTEQIKETLQHPVFIQEIEDDSQVSCYYKFYKQKKEYLYVSIKCSKIAETIFGMPKIL